MDIHASDFLTIALLVLLIAAWILFKVVIGIVTAAATIIVVFPLLVAFVIFQRRFIQSFMRSGLKG